MKAFLSYQTNDKATAALINALLKSMSVEAFMAHEDIEVSNQWRRELLRQLKITDVFIPILSGDYHKSAWCLQESGIAVFQNLTIMPLSIDGTTPLGFMSEFQSLRIDPKAPKLENLLPGLAHRDPKFTIDGLVEKIGKSRGYRTAEANFELIQPYLDRASRKQKVRLLTLSAHNDQIYDAGGCHSVYLPPLISSHGKYMEPADLAKLKQELLKYNVVA